MEDLIKKAKRRIKRYLQTGEKQARVRATSSNTFEYVAEHHSNHLSFRSDKLGRVYLLSK